jgi:hypothetical protein
VITILLIVVVMIGALVAVVLALQSGGPRVTTIEHRTEHKKDGDDA